MPAITPMPWMSGLLVASLLSFWEELLFSLETTTSTRSREQLLFLVHLRMMICHLLVTILPANISENCRNATNRSSKRSSQKLTQMLTVYFRRCLCSILRSATLSRIALSIHTSKSCSWTSAFLITSVQILSIGLGTTSNQPKTSSKRWSGKNLSSK